MQRTREHGKGGAALSDWRSIVEAALRTPSPHNVQPWRVRIRSADEADLLIEKARTLPEEDVTGSFILLTMGTFVEALTWMAAARGFRLRHALVHPPERYSAAALTALDSAQIPFARLTLERGGAAPPPFDEATFRARRTSRIPYDGAPVPEAAARDLAALAARFGQRYGQVTDRAAIEGILRLNIEAVFADLNARGYHDELAGWFRYTDRHARRVRDGLDARCMNQPPFELWLAAHAPRLLTTPLLGRLFAARYRRQIGPVATLGWIAGGFWKSADAFAAGRFLLHFWCAVTAHGLHLHPYGNLVTHRRIAGEVERRLGAAGVWLVFKIGRSAPPPESYRLPLEEVLL